MSAALDEKPAAMVRDTMAYQQSLREAATGVLPTPAAISAPGYLAQKAAHFRAMKAELSTESALSQALNAARQEYEHEDSRGLIPRESVMDRINAAVEKAGCNEEPDTLASAGGTPRWRPEWGLVEEGLVQAGDECRCIDSAPHFLGAVEFGMVGQPVSDFDTVRRRLNQ